MRKAIQYVDVGKSKREAHNMLRSLALQIDYLGGRVIKPSPSRPGWRVQAFFDVGGVKARPSTVLMNGARVVLVPEPMARSMGFR